MSDKSWILFNYAVIGIVLGISPILYQSFPNFFKSIKNNVQRELRVEDICWIIISFGLLWLKESTAFNIMACWVIIAGLSGFQGRVFSLLKFLVVLSGLVIASTLPWWRHNTGEALRFTETELVVFAIITFVTRYLFSTNDATSPGLLTFRLTMWRMALACFALMSLVLSFTTGNLTHNELAISTAWHHWGAYIQSSELLLSGLRIFYDFPAQYGLGPTALIAVGCQISCWKSTYLLTGIFQLVFAWIVCCIALMDHSYKLAPRILILLLCLMCCFFWEGSAFQLMSALVYPSVGGFRFLPVLGLVFVLLWVSSKDNSQRYDIFCHVAWIGAVLWSVESAFYATFVWWPYFILIHINRSTEKQYLILKIFKSGLVLLIWLMTLIVIFLIGYWLSYQRIPDASAFFAYAISPPGPTPIDWHGAIWFYLSTMLLGTITNWWVYQQHGNTAQFRRGFLLLLLSYATFSYYLGRSHDNNILNLLPFQLLVLLEIKKTEFHYAYREYATTLLASLLGLAIVFEWGQSLHHAVKMEFSPQQFIERFAYTNPVTIEKLSERSVTDDPTDIVQAMEYIDSQFGEPYTVINDRLVLASTSHQMVWNALHDWANYAYLPIDQRRQFLRRSASKLYQSGWIIYNKKFPMMNVWLADYDAVYLREKEVDFKTYQAIRFMPR
jgi:hypothetical protein